MSNGTTDNHNINISKTKSWPQIVSIIVFGVVNSIGFYKPNYIVPRFIIEILLIALAFYIVHRTTRTPKELTNDYRMEGYVNGSKIHLDEIQSRKKKSKIKKDCECFDKIIEEITSRINIYNQLRN